MLALWFGTWTGITLFAAHLAARELRSRAVHVDPQFVWMAPASNIILFACVALVLIGLGIRWNRVRSRAVVLSAFFSIAVFSGALLYPRINGWALLVLGIGVGIQLGWLTAPRLDRLMPWIRRSLVGSLALVAVMTTFVNVRIVLRDRANIAALRTPPADAPNVLLIILDTVRALNLGLHGYDRPTSPFLDELAGRGVVFDAAFASAPWTLTSHGTMFTGRWPFELTASWEQPLDDSHPVIAEALTARGYATAGFVANDPFGRDIYGLGRGFLHYSGWPHTFGTMIETSTVLRSAIDNFNRLNDSHYTPERRTAEDIAREFQSWRAGVDGRPWFAFLNLFDAHEPYDPPSPWDTRFGEPQHRRIGTELPSPQLARDLTDAYDGGIAYMDHVLRELFEALDADGSLENTLVIITSDHGELLGERDLLDHGNSLYTPLLHVPLLMAWPGRLPEGLRIDHAVSLRDLPATIAALTPADASFPGRPLSRLWSGPPPAGPDTIYAAVEFAPRQPPWYPLARGDMRSVILWPWHYIVNGDGSEELYDLSVDPAETGPPISEPAVLARMRDVMATFPTYVRAQPCEASTSASATAVAAGGDC
jgi:arylsulfatase A-like enzyme